MEGMGYAQDERDWISSKSCFSRANSYANKNVKYLMCMHCSYLFFLV
jgi:hypothetical protein